MVAVEETSTKAMINGFRMAEKMQNEICVVLFKVKNEKFGTKAPAYELKLFGKTMTEWVANAVYDADIKFVECNFKDNFLPFAKDATNINSKYTVVLFSDTPLFERRTFLQIMEYFKMKKLSVLKLTRGYVFETQYLLNLQNLLNPQTEYFEEEDFITCYDLKQFSIVSDILKNRILTYFMRNGVVIRDTATTFIDADVQIEPNTTICPFVTISGQSIIESDVEIGSNTKIESSVVQSGTKLLGAVVENSFVGKNCVVEQCTKISNNAKIEDGVAVPFGTIVDGVVVKSEDHLKSFCKYTSKEE